jgi:hypothetical protein
MTGLVRFFLSRKELEKEEMIRMARKYSPLFNTITRSAPVSVHLDKE